MKRIIVIVKYECYVDNNVKVSDIDDKIEEQVRQSMEDIVIDSPSGDHQYWFELQNVTTCTYAMIATGDDTKVK